MRQPAQRNRDSEARLPVDPFVLIVIPTLGTRRDYLDMCLESVLAQSYPRVRVVVVGPQESCAPAAAREHAVDFVAQSPSGIGAAINAGWNARGHDAQIWAWLGDDDLLEPRAVERAVTRLRSTGAVMVYGRCRYVDEQGRPLWTARPGRLAAWNLVGGVQLIPQPGSLATAAAVREAGMLDERLRFAMDYDLFLRLQRVGRLVYEPAVLASFRWHDDSLTASQSERSTAEADDVRRRAHRRTPLASRFEPATMKLSKLHWHLQRRPVRLAVLGLRGTVLEKLGREVGTPSQ